jgi:hypothetical protein
MDACRFLAEADDRQRHGPILTEHLKEARGRRLGFYAEAVAALNHREALPFILARLQQDTRLVDEGDELFRVLGALGTFGGDEARQALWAVLERELVDEFSIGTAARALLDAARPEDIGRLAQFCRSRSSREARNRLLDAFAYAGSTSRLAEEVRGAAAHGFEAALEAAEGWLQRESLLSDAALDDLAIAFGREHEGVFPILLREARRLFEERGDDVAGWGAAWDAGASPVGYRRQALMTWLTFETFAAHPASDRDERRNESAIGLALLCQLSVDRDVELVAQHIRDDDLARQIYLRHALGQIPTERSAQALLDVIMKARSFEELDLAALEDNGSSIAIEPLYDRKSAGGEPHDL